jgi:hypothetical protein
LRARTHTGDGDGGRAHRCGAPGQEKVGSGKHHNVSFVRANVSDSKEGMEELQAAVAPHRLSDFTVLYVDIAGTIESTKLLPILLRLRQEIRPRVTVVKVLFPTTQPASVAETLHSLLRRRAFSCES